SCTALTPLEPTRSACRSVDYHIRAHHRRAGGRGSGTRTGWPRSTSRPRVLPMRSAVGSSVQWRGRAPAAARGRRGAGRAARRAATRRVPVGTKQVHYSALDPITQRTLGATVVRFGNAAGGNLHQATQGDELLDRARIIEQFGRALRVRQDQSNAEGLQLLN